MTIESVYVTASFWAQTAERAIKTAAQTAAGAIGATAIVQDLDWQIVGGTAAIATVLSVLSSIGSARLAGDDSPSLV